MNSKNIVNKIKRINEVKKEIVQFTKKESEEKKHTLLAEEAWHLIQNKRVKDISKLQLKEEIEQREKVAGFNLYKYIRQYY